MTSYFDIIMIPLQVMIVFFTIYAAEFFSLSYNPARLHV